MSTQVPSEFQTTAPLVSAIIPVHNGEAFLADAIQSVLTQTYSHVECVVVDDGSTDNTTEVVRSFGSRVRSVQKPNGGVASARNAGVIAARGDYVAFLDADDLWKPEKLERQLSLFRERRELGLVYAAVDLVDETLNLIGQMDAPEGSVALRNTLLMELPVMAIAMTGVLPRPVFDNVGGFDERLTTSADTDFACRVACRHPVEGVAMPLALYRQHGAQMHLNPRTMEHDMLLVLAKMFGGEPLPAAVRRLRRQAFANLHSILAMAYAREGEIGRLVGHVLAAIGNHPGPLVTRVGKRAWHKFRMVGWVR